MISTPSFDELLEAVEHLSADEQVDLITIIQRRLAEKGRQRVIADTEEARREFKAGATPPTSASDLMREIEG